MTKFHKISCITVADKSEETAMRSILLLILGIPIPIIILIGLLDHF
jgi:hypothetical protein